MRSTGFEIRRELLTFLHLVLLFSEALGYLVAESQNFGAILLSLYAEAAGEFLDFSDLVLARELVTGSFRSAAVYVIHVVIWRGARGRVATVRCESVPARRTSQSALNRHSLYDWWIALLLVYKGTVRLSASLASMLRLLYVQLEGLGRRHDWNLSLLRSEEI